MSEMLMRDRQPMQPPEELVAALLKHMRNGTTDLCDSTMQLDPSIFTDPEAHQLEIDGVFGTVPFIAAHSSEVPEPHSYITKRLARNEVVILRQPDGSLKTFVNLCRHRGATLLTEEQGHCRMFSCPYHGWSYNVDGKLRAVTYPDSFGEVDTDKLNLIELPTEERHGLIWVVDNHQASIDVAAWLGPEMDRILASYGLDKYHCFRARPFDEPVNWKILHDAFLDGYHIKYAHPQSAGKLIHTNIYTVEDFGHHARFGSPRKSLDAWLDRDPDLSTEWLLPHVMVTHFVGPNTTLLQLQDNFQILSFYPISDNPGEARMEMRVIVPTVEDSGLDEQTWTDKWEKNWHILQKVLAAEDFPILRGIQKAYTSRDRSHSPTLLGRNEVLNQAFHREVAKLRNAAAQRR